MMRPLSALLEKERGELPQMTTQPLVEALVYLRERLKTYAATGDSVLRAEMRDDLRYLESVLEHNPSLSAITPIGVGKAVLALESSSIVELCPMRSDFVALAPFLGLSASFPKQGLLLETPKGRVGVGVDRVERSLMTLIRPLGKFLSPLHYYTGAAILGPGVIVPILNATVIHAKENHRLLV